MRSKIARSLDSYEQVIWLAGIPGEPECHCVAWEESAGGEPGGAWLEARKPRLHPPPELPPDLAPGSTDTDLFSLYQQQKELGEAHEVILAAR